MNTAKRSVVAILLILSAIGGFAFTSSAATLNAAEYRDKVYACWLGKNIGGTLGVPFEGRREPNDITFYTNLKPGEPAANDDLDLQLLWLKALEEHNGQVDARILGEYWLKFVPVDWNEYGVGKRNMGIGILPPLSGEYDNTKWKPSNGAWIRTEIWACVAPGDPMLAARMAREDACVDHGAAEGTIAAIFVAAIESAAFVEHDRDTLLKIGLAAIPDDSRLAVAVRTAIDAHKAGKDWKAAREAVIAATEDTGWFQAPRNVAYTMLGWLYGEGDFGKSLCIAINCGDDTDCTGATLGSIFGIIGGTQGIPKNWSDPIGKKINTIAVSGFPAPADLDALTDHTVAMARKLTARPDAPLRIADDKTDLAATKAAQLVDPKKMKEVWDLSPYQIVWNTGVLNAILDYVKDPCIVPTESASCALTVTNKTSGPEPLTIVVSGLPSTWSVSGLPEVGSVAEPGKPLTARLAVSAPIADTTPYRMRIGVSLGDRQTVWIPYTLVGKPAPGKGNLALASAGATASSDGELDREPGCTAKAIDGILATPEDFSNRWHSSIATPHPHWLQVTLPETKKVGRVAIHFADPTDHPVDFSLLARTNPDQPWARIAALKAYTGDRLFEAAIAALDLKEFRIELSASSSKDYPNATQISEVELYPAQP